MILAEPANNPACTWPSISASRVRERHYGPLWIWRQQTRQPFGRLCRDHPAEGHQEAAAIARALLRRLGTLDDLGLCGREERDPAGERPPPGRPVVGIPGAGSE